MKTNKTFIITFTVILLCSFVFCLSEISHAAVMPGFERLQPIKTNIDAPTSIAFDSQENVYVVESSNNKLLIYTQSGEYKRSFTGLNKPKSVAVDTSGRIFIGNEGRKNVEVYNSSFTLLFKLGTGNGEFIQPNDIEIDSNGKIYVVDKEGDVVTVYNVDGSFNFSFGSSGNGDGQFHSPTSLEIDEVSGEIIVLDHQLATDNYGNLADGARIQIFDMSGTFKSGFSKYGQNVGQMYRPQHIAIDKEERIYVTDSFQNVVLVYNKNGTYLGAVYNLEKSMRTPLGIALSKSNRLFIVSLITSTVEIYGIDNYTQMNVSPLHLIFTVSQYGGNISSQGVEIINNGKEALNWTASTNEGWVILPELSGTAGISGSSILNIGINIDGLTPNTYTGNITISAQSGATETVNIQLTVLPTPVLTINPSLFEFTSINGSVPSSQNMSVTNTGEGILDWAASSDKTWLLISKNTGTAPDTIEVSVNIDSLSVGTYTGTLTITGENALSSPAVIPVTLNIVKQTGTANVITNLSSATFILNGPESFSGAGTNWTKADAPVGTYSIVFKDIDGYITPSFQSQNLQAGETITFSGEYTSNGSEKTTSNNKEIIVGAGPGKQNAGTVKVFNADGSETGTEFLAHNYKYGVNVAAGDINCDGVDEIITAPGPGPDNPAEIKIFDSNGKELTNLAFTAYEYKYGANIASGDFKGDGEHEVVVGTAEGKDDLPYIKVFVYDPAEQKMIDSGINQLAYETGHGVKVASGDIDKDGVDEIITVLAQSSKEPVVKIWEIDTSLGIGQWSMIKVKEYSVKSKYKYSMSISSGDTDGDVYEEVITTGLDKKARNEIQLYDSNTEIVSKFRAYIAKGYVLNIAGGDLDNDGSSEIVAGAGPGSKNKAIVKVFDANGIEQAHFKALNTKYGVNVAVGYLCLGQ